ncbi:DUF6768 family protein [Hyphobacterium sp.]|jgi:hypothetical protein|uniref:DUF6768 family protein n=1 Tax=Hyphobacterium sp. TaxID=2004662 RepID=UPI003BA9D245
MSDFNTTLNQALTEDEESFLRRLDDEPGLFEQLGNTFQGKLKFWTAYAFVMSFVIFIAAIYCFWQLLNAETTRGLILWATGTWCLLLSVGLTKIWFWMRMNHIAMLREIKRIELYLAKNDPV